MQQPPPQQPPDEIGEDLYTSATADLSAGGVAMARESAEEQEQASPAESVGGGGQGSASARTPAQAYAREDLVNEPERPSFGTQYDASADGSEGRSKSPIDPGWAIAGGALMALGGGIGGAWLYSRWQRERNRPINRLRRRARGVVGTLGERLEDVGDRFGDVGERFGEVSDRFGDMSEWLPDAEDVRESAPMGGGAAALLIGGLLAARLLHVGGWGQAGTPQSTARAAKASTLRTRLGGQLGSLRDLDVQRLGGQLSSLRDLDVQAARGRISSISSSMPAQPMGFGIGGLLGACAFGYLVWRLVRGGGGDQYTPQPDARAWYDAAERRAEVPNQ
jgi:hypothetical protein